MDKTERLKELIKAILKEDPQNLTGITVREGLVNIGIGIVLAFVVVVHLVSSLWQTIVALLTVGYDLTTKVLEKIMPAPKKAASNPEDR